MPKELGREATLRDDRRGVLQVEGQRMRRSRDGGAGTARIRWGPGRGWVGSGTGWGGTAQRGGGGWMSGRGGVGTARPRRRRGRDGARVCFFLAGGTRGTGGLGSLFVFRSEFLPQVPAPCTRGRYSHFFHKIFLESPLPNPGKKPHPRAPPFRHSIPSSIFKIQTSCGLLNQAVLCPHSSCRRSECISLISRLASNNLLQKISKYLRSSKRKNDRSISSRF
jgi:hypothetical protein